MPIERHSALAREIDELIEDIPDPTSILEEARAGRRARGWYGFALSFLALSIVSSAAPHLPFGTLPFEPLFEYLPFLLWVILASILIAGFVRRGPQAPFSSASRRRMKLWGLVKSIRKHERKHSKTLGEIVAQAKRHRESFRATPQDLQSDALACADELASASFTLPIGASEAEYVGRGNTIKWWRPWFWAGVAAFVIVLVASVGALNPMGSFAPRLSAIFVSGLFLFWGAAILALLIPTIRLISLRGFHSDGAKAVAISSAQVKLLTVLHRATRYGRENAMGLSRSVAEARRRLRAAERSKTVFDETREGIARAMDDATSRAIIQAIAGSVIAIAGLSIAAYFFIGTHTAFEQTAQSGGDTSAAFLAVSVAKLLFALGSNALAFFFLFGFRKSQADAKFFRNELTTIEGRMVALGEARQLLKELDDPELKRFAVATAGMILIHLGSVERNPIHTRGSANANVQEHQAINAEAQILAEFARLRGELRSPPRPI